MKEMTVGGISLYTIIGLAAIGLLVTLLVIELFERRKARRARKAKPEKVILTELEDTKEVFRLMTEGRTVVLDMLLADEEDCQRMIDIVAGACYISGYYAKRIDQDQIGISNDLERLEAMAMEDSFDLYGEGSPKGEIIPIDELRARQSQKLP